MFPEYANRRRFHKRPLGLEKQQGVYIYLDKAYVARLKELAASQKRSLSGYLSDLIIAGLLQDGGQP